MLSFGFDYILCFINFFSEFIGKSSSDGPSLVSLYSSDESDKGFEQQSYSYQQPPKKKSGQPSVGESRNDTLSQIHPEITESAEGSSLIEVNEQSQSGRNSSVEVQKERDMVMDRNKQVETNDVTQSDVQLTESAKNLEKSKIHSLFIPGNKIN